jgi:hypothetical protein
MPPVHNSAANDDFTQRLPIIEPSTNDSGVFPAVGAKEPSSQDETDGDDTAGTTVVATRQEPAASEEQGSDARSADVHPRIVTEVPTPPPEARRRLSTGKQPPLEAQSTTKASNGNHRAAVIMRACYIVAAACVVFAAAICAPLSLGAAPAITALGIAIASLVVANVLSLRFPRR